MTSSRVGDGSASGRLTSKSEWDGTWSRAVDGRKRTTRLRMLESLDWQLARLIVDSFSRVSSASPRPRALELGCANSIWLPVLGRDPRTEVVGVDFSERGCALAQQNLLATGVQGTKSMAGFSV